MRAILFCLAGSSEEISDGTQKQRRESGEVPGRTKETAQEESGQQETLQIWRQGDAGESVLLFKFQQTKRTFKFLFGGLVTPN